MKVSKTILLDKVLVTVGDCFVQDPNPRAFVLGKGELLPVQVLLEVLERPRRHRAVNPCNLALKFVHVVEELLDLLIIRRLKTDTYL